MVRYIYHMTQQILSYFQIGVAILLGVAILIQQKGQGLSGAFGGEGGFYRTKRGLEKTLLIATIVLAVLFVAIGISRIIFVSPTSEAPSLIESDSQPTTNNSITVPQTEVEVSAEPVLPNSSE